MPTTVLFPKTTNCKSFSPKTNSKINNNEYRHYREIIVFILRIAAEYIYLTDYANKNGTHNVRGLLHYGQRNRIFENIKIYINRMGATVLKPPSHHMHIKQYLVFSVHCTIQILNMF